MTAAGWLAIAAAMAAQTGQGSSPPSPSPDCGTIYAGREGDLDVPAYRVMDAAIIIDGDSGDPDWECAPTLTDFTQSDPVEGASATQNTEAKIVVSKDAVFVSVRAFDREVNSVRATLSDRDSFARTDDYIGIVLDTFNDQRRAYVIRINPLGVQQDGLWVVGSARERGGFGPPIDWNPDFVWESSGAVREWGYEIEVRIPFKSIRFRDQEVQEWGLQITRQIARSGYASSWAPITSNVANQLGQFGRLTGLERLDPGLFLEASPTQTVSWQGRYDDADGAFLRDGVESDFGFGVTYGITPNLTLDGTYNPDFSQVEADAGQIRVNERFALYLREKRPFFLEGTEIFDLPQQLVYTRSIVNPVAGAKLTGKLGSFSLGYLGAVDELADEGQPDGVSNPIANILRVRRDLGSASSVGFAYTDRASSSSNYNRVLGMDGRFQFRDRYTVALLAAGSRTAQEASVANHGALVAAQFSRSGRNFSFNLQASDISDLFRARSGFIRRTGVANGRIRASYNVRGAQGDLVERWGPSVDVRGTWDHDEFWSGAGPRELYLQMGGSVSFRRNISVWGNIGLSSFDYPGGEYAGLYTRASGRDPISFSADPSTFRGLFSATLFTWINAIDQARGSLRVTRSESPIFDFATGAPVDLADSWVGDASLRLQPVEKLTGELGVTFTRMSRKRDGSSFSAATIPRVRAQYQFDRALFIRAIGEYGSQRRGALLSPYAGEPILRCEGGSCAMIEGSESNDFSTEFLLGYEPSPGTVFFLGYTRRMDEIDAFRFRDLRTRADGVFVKGSYRLRA